MTLSEIQAIAEKYSGNRSVTIESKHGNWYVAKFAHYTNSVNFENRLHWLNVKAYHSGSNGQDLASSTEFSVSFKAE